jgi:hypothetical protein
VARADRDAEGEDGAVKSLYEFLNGHIGESYVRCYVWADSEEEARTLALQSFWSEKGTGGSIVRMRKLFDADAPSFATQQSDTGFNDDEL